MSDPTPQQEAQSWRAILADAVFDNLYRLYLAMFLVFALFWVVFAATVLHIHGYTIAVFAAAEAKVGTSLVGTVEPFELYANWILVTLAGVSSLHTYLDKRGASS